MKTRKKIACTTAIAAAMFAGTALAYQGPVPTGVPHLDHVFLIMMENHSYSQIVGNPAEPYLNSLISSGTVSVANNYFAVGHPSSTNYLEIVGGSNFGVRSDNAPDFHNAGCMTNLQSGVINADDGANISSPVTMTDSEGVQHSYAFASTKVCPISGTGVDAITDAVDNWNEVYPPNNYLANFDGITVLDQATKIDGMTIADQIAARGRQWRSYQESLPFAGADNVAYSNGTVNDTTPSTNPAYANLPNVGNLPGTLYDQTGNAVSIPGGYVKLYAAKHNPFVYFKSVQENTRPNLGLNDIRPFDGSGGLYADLALGFTLPEFSFIAPNQCNDQHGRGNGDSFCSFDPSDTGAQSGLNTGLIAQGDATIQRLVTSIKASPAWKQGRSAIVIVWDENDYSGVSSAPPLGTAFPELNQNRVVVTVDTNYRTSPSVASPNYYNHFSLLKSIEGGLGLPCLNHACDKNVQVMSDLFSY